MATDRSDDVDKVVLATVMRNGRQLKTVGPQTVIEKVLDKDNQNQRQAVIDKYATIKVQEIKDRILTTLADNRYPSSSWIVYFNPEIKLYDGYPLSDMDFVDEFDWAFWSCKRKDSRLKMSVFDNYIRVEWLPLVYRYIFEVKDEFLQHMMLVLGDGAGQGKTKQQRQQLPVLSLRQYRERAKLNYKHLLQAMLEASQKGLSAIDYSILSTADGRTTDNNNFNFIFHSQWLTRDNSDIVVKLEYENSVDLYLSDKTTRLVWYEKNSFDWGLN